jgi:glycosyltransferase involved in cell wall biosynthesis
MNILLISSTCSKSKYQNIFKERNYRYIDPSQNFFDNLINGIVENKDINIDCLTILPVSASVHRKYYFKYEIEEIKYNLRYHYLKLYNGRISRYLSQFIEVYMHTEKWIKNNNNIKRIVICDPTLVFASFAARIASKRFKIKVVALITDMPKLVTSIKHKDFNFLRRFFQQVFDCLAERDISKYDGYILLTEKMNEVVNKKNVPSIIIEGSVNILMSSYENILVLKDRPMSIVYAGGLHKQFGLEKLVKAFHKSTLKNVQLKIFGTGLYVDEIIRYSKFDSRIKYMGVVPVEEIIKQEIAATLLINPRPSNKRFTLYSFPSKTLEYLVSGTPVLSTRLKGISEEYEEYLYWFNEENEENMRIKIEEIMSLSKDKLHFKGKKAKEWVLKNKNNITQGRKIIKFINKLN